MGSACSMRPVRDWAVAAATDKGTTVVLLLMKWRKGSRWSTAITES